MKKFMQVISMLLVCVLLLLSLTGCGNRSAKRNFPAPTEAQQEISLRAEQMPMQPVAWEDNFHHSGAYFYDEQGRLIREEYTCTKVDKKVRCADEYQYESWKDGSKVTIRTYDLDKYPGLHADEQRQSEPLIWVCYLDADGKCVTREGYWYSSLVERSVYSYDTEGLPFLIETELYRQSESLHSKIIFSWDKAGRLVQCATEWLDRLEIRTYHRNAFGDVVQMEVDRMRIDDNGNVLESESRPVGRGMLMSPLPRFAAQPQVQWYTIDYAWEYTDKNGRLDKKSIHNLTGSGSSDIQYRYDEDGNLCGAVTEWMSGHEFVHCLTFGLWWVDGQSAYHPFEGRTITWAVVAQ